MNKMFTDIDWQYVIERFVHVGLIFGAIFQVICIGAAIFLPSKSELEMSNDESNHSNKKPLIGNMRTNERFLDESDDQQDDDYDSNESNNDSDKIYGNRLIGSLQNIHHRHRINYQINEMIRSNRSSLSSSLSSSSSLWTSNLNKIKEKKKRK